MCRSQDKLICTELVYRAYAPHLDVPFDDVMGRKTLKPDGMLRELSPAAEDPGKLEPGTMTELLATVM